MKKFAHVCLSRGTAFLGVAAVAAGILAVPAAAMDRSEQLRVGGSTRTYSVHVPSGPRPAGGFPVVIAFHGGGMQGAGMRRMTHFDAVADQRGFVVVYPDGIDKHWNDGRATIRNPQDDVGFVSAMIDQVERSYPINDHRIFATGISNGALFAERLGCDLSQRIAAIAPVAGTLPTDIASTCRPARKLAVLQIDGTADPIMPYRGGPVKDFGGKGEGGMVTSVADTSIFWARHNGCGGRGAPEPLPKVAPFDPTRIVRMRYMSCPVAGQVTVMTVIGGGHVWPGSDQMPRPRITGRPSRQIDASEAMADFFLSQPASMINAYRVRRRGGSR